MFLDITEEELEMIYEEILVTLGAEDIDVNVSKREVLITLRRALLEFDKETSIWQLHNQFSNVYGQPAGLLLSNQIATFNMSIVQQITDWFASMQRIGGKIPWHKDYITLEPGRQIYDLSVESSHPFVSGTRRYHRVMWIAAPELFEGYHFNGRLDNIQGDDILYSSSWNFTNAGLNYGSNPLTFLGYGFDTILMLQSIEERRKILFSEMFYNLSGDILELTPMPGSKSLSIRPGTRVFYYYWDEREVIAGRKVIDNTITNLTSSELEMVTDVNTGGITGPTATDMLLISNPADMKINVTPWSMLSPWARTWIFDFALARSKYIWASKLRMIKKTFSTGEMSFEIEFDYQSLLSEAQEEITQLRDRLREDMKELNLSTITQEKEQMVNSSMNINKYSPRLWKLA